MNTYDILYDYGYVILSAMASQATGASIVCSRFFSGADKKASKLRLTGFVKVIQNNTIELLVANVLPSSGFHSFYSLMSP